MTPVESRSLLYRAQWREIMTFSFKAIGSKDEVIGQLKAVDDSNFGDLGKAARDLIVSNLQATSGQAVHSADQWAIKYDVTGSGHGDSNSINFRVECTAHWVPQVKPDAVETPEGAPGDVPAQVSSEGAAQNG